jgi:hypothetical protein
MLERKRRTKTSFTGEDGEEFDVELGEGLGPQEDGIVHEATLEEEVDNWDENAEDWDDDEPTTTGSQPDDSTKAVSSEDSAQDSKTRND